MRTKIRIAISWLLVIATMAIIFRFSSQNSSDSTDTSEGVIENILGTIIGEEAIRPSVVQKMQLPIRKIAHFGIFMLLGFCLANAFKLSINKRELLSYLLAGVTSILYAISDELHQAFTYGRYALATDVVIDSTGAIIGIALLFCLDRFVKFLNKRKARTS